MRGLWASVAVAVVFTGVASAQFFRGGVTAIPDIQVLTPGGSWNGTALSGGTPPALDATVHGALSITGTASATNGIQLTVASNATVASGDEWNVSGVVGTTEANGTWLVAIPNADTTHVIICQQVNTTGTGCLAGPAFVNAYVSGGTLGVQIAPTVAFDEVAQQLITADNTETIAVAAAIPNRGWIAYVTCYFEGTTVTTTYNKRTTNPAYGTHGVVFTVNGDKVHDGKAELVCDAFPVNGKAARIATQFWINEPGLSGVITRQAVYADASMTLVGSNVADTGACNHSYTDTPITGGSPSGGNVRGSQTYPWASITYAVVCGLGGSGQDGAQVYARNTNSGDAAHASTFADTAAAAAPNGQNLGNSHRVDVNQWGADVYTLGLKTIGPMYISAQNVAFHNPVINNQSVLTIQGCVGGNCTNPPLDSYGAWVESLVFQNCTIEDTDGPTGPTYGTYAGTQATYHSGFTVVLNRYNAVTECSAPQVSGGAQSLQGATLLRNITGTNSADFLDLQFAQSATASGATSVGSGNTYLNVSMTAPVFTSGAHSGQYQFAFDRWSREPAASTTNATAVGAENNASGLPVVSAVVFAGGNTTVTFTTGATSTTSVPGALCAQFPLSSYNTALSATWSVACNGPSLSANSYTPQSGGSATVTFNGVDLTCADSPSSCVAVNDVIFTYYLQHQDAYQIFIAPVTQGETDFNTYVENYFVESNAQSSFFQMGGYTSTPSSATITTVGTAVSCGSCSGAVVAGQFIHVITGSNIDQYRRVTVGGTTSFTIDHAFSPDISVGSNFNIGNTAERIACINCRIGGTTTGSAGNNPSGGLAGGDQAQFQHGMEDWVWVQATTNFTALFFRANNTATTGSGQAGAFGAQYSAIYDSDLGFGNSGSVVANTAPIYDSGTADTVFQSYVEGLSFDSNNYIFASVTGTPQTQIQFGSNNTNQATLTGVPQGQASISDTGFSPAAGGWLTKTIRGTKGNPYLADGSPLYPWNPSGSAISAGALVGAIR